MRLCLILIACLLLQLVNAQQPQKYEAAQGFVAHEWGTFTTLRKSNGQVLSGLEREEEHLPDFVYNLCQCFQYQNLKGYGGYFLYSLKNVTVKMETPVLYFYSSESTEKNVLVDVQFKTGSISQWYPNRAIGEQTVIPFIYESTGNNNPHEVIDFAVPKDGWIQWEATVLPPTENIPFSNDPLKETSTWTGPRATASNLIKIKNGLAIWNTQLHQFTFSDQIEKFLFYRGIGNFQEPVNVEFNSQGNLVVTNTGSEPISYAMVYEKRKDGKTLVWWADSLSTGRKKVIEKPGNNSPIDPAAEHENFVHRLIAAGLYEDEARAMLKTWEQSYFGHEGLKVFWIVPRSFTEEVLPMQLKPAPDAVSRVLIGRSEILTPEFEKQLAAMTNSLFRTTYANDRFLVAYQQLLDTGIPDQWTDYNVLDKPDVVPVLAAETAGSFEVFPNPVSGELTIKLNQTGKIKIYDYTGALVRSLQDAKAGENKVTLENLSAGAYLIIAEYPNGNRFSKKVVKE